MNVWLRQNRQLTQKLWEKSADLGDKWRFGQATVKSDVDFQIVFEGIRKFLVNKNKVNKNDI